MRLFTTVMELTGMAAIATGADLRFGLWAGLITGGAMLLVAGGFLGRDA